MGGVVDIRVRLVQRVSGGLAYMRAGVHVSEVFIRRLSRWQAEQQREDVADVYVEAYHRVHGEEFHDRQEFLRAFAEDVQRTGFDMVVASGGGKPAAHAYGFLLDRDGEWWRGLDDGVPWDVEELTVSGQVFGLAELMVLPAFRRSGVATRMVEQLLLRTDAALVTMRIDPANEAAVGALRSWGWTRLGVARSAASEAVPSVGVGVGASGTGAGAGVGGGTDVWCRALTP